MPCPLLWIGASNAFELAAAIASALFGRESVAAFTTVVGVLIELPAMPSVCSCISRLATVQEHLMIVRAIERGVSEDKLAKALNMDVKAIRRRRTMLAGICPEVVDMFKDKSVNPNTFEILRKMKPMRQLEAAELMKARPTTPRATRKRCWRRPARPT
jgi:hypothetical protein